MPERLLRLREPALLSKPYTDLETPVRIAFVIGPKRPRRRIARAGILRTFSHLPGWDFIARWATAPLPRGAERVTCEPTAPLALLGHGADSTSPTCRAWGLALSRGLLQSKGAHRLPTPVSCAMGATGLAEVPPGAPRILAKIRTGPTRGSCSLATCLGARPYPRTTNPERPGTPTKDQSSHSNTTRLSDQPTLERCRVSPRLEWRTCSQHRSLVWGSVETDQALRGTERVAVFAFAAPGQAPQPSVLSASLGRFTVVAVCRRCYGGYPAVEHCAAHDFGYGAGRRHPDCHTRNLVRHGSDQLLLPLVRRQNGEDEQSLCSRHWAEHQRHGHGLQLSRQSVGYERDRRTCDPGSTSEHQPARGQWQS